MGARPMKILLTGAAGQVGYELERSLQGLGQVFAADRARMDLADLARVRSVIRELRPDVIVNAAAYTAVDRAETEQRLALAVNAHAPAVMAEEARASGAALVHFSTNYVFDGTSTRPYVETDPTAPVNAYGRAKLEGELAIAASGARHLVLRTGWVFGLRGNNFLQTMLRLCRERAEVAVVDDQRGSPTWSRTIADATALVLARSQSDGWWEQHGGIYHLTSRGETSWHGFTRAIIENAGLNCRVIPIKSSEYRAVAARPANGVLNCDKLAARLCSLPDWRHALDLCMA